MEYDVIVIAGTTESRQVIERETALGCRVLATVATDLGAKMLEKYPVDVHVGRMDYEGFVTFFRKHPCKKVVDASHPFAKIVTETVQKAAKTAGIPYERYVRPELDYHYDQIHRVADAEEAIAALNQMEGNVLLTTGANTAGAYLRGVTDSEKRVYVRVLDTELSHDACQKAGYDDSHVIYEMPPYNLEDNLRVIRETNAAVLVSKDSGKTGGVDVKVEACRKTGIPVILIGRPAEKPEKTEEREIPRVLIAGANSGCGKTSITCGILKALTDRGIRVQPYKCGPDYIDPMLHSHITGRDCRNLDPFFSEESDLRTLMAKDSLDADFTVTEGVMGYYDGIGVSCEKSTWTVSKATNTPTILIINVKGMSHTMIPLIKGIIDYQDNPVAGVILNRCTRGLYMLMKPEIERELGIQVVGYFPQKEGIYIGSRHLGLMTAAEIENLDEVIQLLGETAEEGIDLDLLLEIGRAAEPLPEGKEKPVPCRNTARIAVAMDKAFCFYYKENLEILEQLGAQLVPFSPISDAALPEGIGGIYLGGGYPETYRKQLSSNESMRTSIRNAVSEGKPVFAECGGFMYCCENLTDTDGSSEPMLGLVPTDCVMTKRLNMEFGYVTLDPQEDSPFLRKGEQIRAHEFHYSKAVERGKSCVISKYSKKRWNGVYTEGRVMAGYPHFYFHNCLEVARRFVEMAGEFMGG